MIENKESEQSYEGQNFTPYAQQYSNQLIFNWNIDENNESQFQSINKHQESTFNNEFHNHQQELVSQNLKYLNEYLEQEQEKEMEDQKKPLKQDVQLNQIKIEHVNEPNQPQLQKKKSKILIIDEDNDLSVNDKTFGSFLIIYDKDNQKIQINTNSIKFEIGEMDCIYQFYESKSGTNDQKKNIYIGNHKIFCQKIKYGQYKQFNQYQILWNGNKQNTYMLQLQTKQIESEGQEKQIKKKVKTEVQEDVVEDANKVKYEDRNRAYKGIVRYLMKDNNCEQQTISKAAKQLEEQIFQSYKNNPKEYKDNIKRMVKHINEEPLFREQILQLYI